MSKRKGQLTIQLSDYVSPEDIQTIVQGFINTSLKRILVELLYLYSHDALTSDDFFDIAGNYGIEGFLDAYFEAVTQHNRDEGDDIDD